MLQIRLTESEKQLIEQAAKDARQSVTAWLVEAARQHAGRRRPRDEQPVPSVIEQHQRQLAARRQNRRRW